MSTLVSIAPKAGFYEKIILDLFSKMNHGTLNITLPNGTSIKLGTDNNISANIEIKNSEFFKRCVLYGDIGFGEAYVDRLWETDNITNVIKWFLINIDNAPDISGSNSKTLILTIFKFFNKIFRSKKTNTIIGSKKNISEHYDLNNDFFALFLDEATAALPDEDQEELYRLLKDKLPGTTLVSIGHRTSLAAFHPRKLVVRENTLAAA